MMMGMLSHFLYVREAHFPEIDSISPYKKKVWEWYGQAERVDDGRWGGITYVYICTPGAFASLSLLPGTCTLRGLHTEILAGSV